MLYRWISILGLKLQSAPLGKASTARSQGLFSPIIDFSSFIDLGKSCHGIYFKCKRWYESWNRPQIDLRSELCQELKKLFPTSKSNIGLLESGARELELNFVQIISAVEEFPGTCTKMLEASANLCMLEAHDDSEEALALVRSPLNYLNSIPEQIRILDTDLRSTVQLVEDLLEIELELKRVLSPMNLIRTYLKIESSKLPASEQAVFFMLSREIDSMQQSLDFAITTDLTSLCKVNDTVRSLAFHLQEFSRKQTHTLEQKKKLVDQGIRDLHLQIEENQRQNQQFSDYARQVKQQISQLVTSVQAQDAINQKISHLGTGVKRLVDGHQEACFITKDKLDSSIIKLRTFCRLEQAHANAIVGDLMKCRNEIEQSRLCIESIVSKLQKDCSEIIQKNERKELNATENLIVVSRELRKLLDDSVVQAEQLYLLFSPLQEQTSSISSTIQEISFKMRLISLNTQVQAAQFGSGTGLEVVAKQAAQIAYETDLLGLRVADASARIENNINRVVACCRQIQAGGKEQQELINTNCTKKETKMFQMRESGLKNLMTTSTKMQTLIRAIQIPIKRDPPIVSLLKKLSAMFGMISYLIEGTYPNEDLQGSDSEIDHRSHGYSMESERKVHESILGKPVTKIPESPAVAPLTSIEFFDDPPGIVSSNPGIDLFSQSEATPTPGLIDLFEEPIASTPAEPKLSDPPLADNIELF